MLASNNAVSIVYSVSKNVFSNNHFDKGGSGQLGDMSGDSKPRLNQVWLLDGL